jgi:DNA-binding GntR family transcriptional regulator
LADELRRRILSGQLKPRDNFPTEAELCREHDVSRFTVREALRRLQSEGLIERRRGSGTVVHPAAARGGALHQPLSNVSEILQYARGTKVQFERLAEGPVPPRYAEQLAGDFSGSWARLSGVRTDLSGDPIAFTEVFVHPSLTWVVDSLDPTRATIFRQLTDGAGLKVAQVTQEIQAVPAGAPIARHLDLAPRAPCLRVMRCYSDDKGFLFELSVSHHPGDRFAYSMHIEVEG